MEAEAILRTSGDIASAQEAYQEGHYSKHGEARCCRKRHHHLRNCQWYFAINRG
jgi:hypothetical protein